LLFATNTKGNTAWDMAAEDGKTVTKQKIYDLAKECLTKEEIKNRLLLATNSEGNTAWHLAAEKQHFTENTSRNICDLVKEYLTTEEIKNKLLFATNRKGNTAWTLGAKEGNTVTMQKIHDFAENYLTTGEI
jgi:ankyrin repeat protein